MSSRTRPRIADRPPPGPFRSTFWRSPLRGPWLTSLLGLILLVGIGALFVTGLISYAAYNPDIAHGMNNHTPHDGLLGLVAFGWPTHPAWLYRLTQGVHVVGGLALVPVLLAKLWSVIPKLFAWPLARSLAQLLERASLLLLVGGGLFEFVTGILNIQYWYVFPGSFYTAHFYGAWIFIGAFVVHVAFRLPRIGRTMRSRSFRAMLASPVPGTRPAPADADESADTKPTDAAARGEATELIATAPAEATISRRGLLGLVLGSSGLIALLSAGQTIGGPMRRIALLSTRGGPGGGGPDGDGSTDFAVNKTAAMRGVGQSRTGDAWRLELRGTRTIRMSRADLLAMPQHTQRLPIACVEGWSTTQVWTGVRLADLAAMAGMANPGTALVESLQQTGSFGSAALRGNQVLDRRSLLALSVNGAALSLNHGYPARVIVPNNPGVHQTKWVSKMTFRS